MIALVISFILLASGAEAQKPVVRVGSKAFTEGYVLAEILAQTIEAEGEATVERKFGMGGTGIVHAALEKGEIDLYPEYSGTISHSILKKPDLSLDAIRLELAASGLILGNPLGFNNTYAIAASEAFAQKHNLRSISDLGRVRDARAAMSHEFLRREDGLPAMSAAYRISIADVRGMEHSLAYEAISSGRADLIEVYSTDAKILKFGLRILDDDRRFFPPYEGLILAREEFAKRFPASWAALRRLEGSLDTSTMTRLNARVENDGKSFAEAAAEFMGRRTSAEASRIAFWGRIWTRTREHVVLVLISLLAAIAVGIPLGVLADRYRTLGQVVLVISGLLQTIPSLALLCFLIPLFGIGLLPSLIALFLYGLLPIVRGTYTGLLSIDPRLRESGLALGLTSWQRLRLIELPLASVSVLSGVKTSAVISVGTATLAALIGAGGYGALIVTGLALNDTTTILMGAIPAALLALVAHAVFEWVDRIAIPKGLRIK